MMTNKNFIRLDKIGVSYYASILSFNINCNNSKKDHIMQKTMKDTIDWCVTRAKFVSVDVKSAADFGENFPAIKEAVERQKTMHANVSPGEQLQAVLADSKFKQAVKGINIARADLEGVVAAMVGA